MSSGAAASAAGRQATAVSTVSVTTAQPSSVCLHTLQGDTASILLDKERIVAAHPWHLANGQVFGSLDAVHWTCMTGHGHSTRRCKIRSSVLGLLQAPTAADCTHLLQRYLPQHVPLQLPNCLTGKQHLTGYQLGRRTSRPCCCPASGPAPLVLPAAGRLLLPAPAASLPVLAAHAPPVVLQ